MKSVQDGGLKENTASAMMIIDAMKAIIEGKGYDLAEAQRSLLQSDMKKNQEFNPVRDLNHDFVVQPFNDLKSIVENKAYVSLTDIYIVENYGLNEPEVQLFNENFNIFLHK